MRSETRFFARCIAGSGAVGLLALTPCIWAVDARRWVVSTGWLLAETLIAVAATFLLGLVTSISMPARIDKWLDRSISRGLEVAAALPLVLTSAVIVVLAAIPVPIATAMVVGTLGGLRCAHIVLSLAPRKQRGDEPARHMAKLRHELPLRISIASLPSLLEQLIGLEAAFSWLDLHSGTEPGGWGACLGRAALRGDLTQLAAWTLATLALSVGLKLITAPRRRRQHGPGEPGIQSSPPSV